MDPKLRALRPEIGPGTRVAPFDAVEQSAWLMKLAKVASLAAVVAGFYFLHQLSEVSAQCFQSSVLSSLVNLLDNHAFSNCETAWPLKEGPKGEMPTSLRQTIAKVERLTEVWPAPREALNVVIGGDDPFLYLVSLQESENETKFPTQIILGTYWAQNSVQVARAIVDAWVQGQDLPRTEFEREILIDFLTSIALKDPTTLNIDGRASENLDWRQYWVDSKEPCLSVYRLAKQVNHCEGLEDFWSLRPVLSQMLIRLYDLASWAHQREFLSSLKASAESEEWILDLSRREDESVLTALERHFFDWSQKLGLSASEPRLRKLREDLGLNAGEPNSLVWLESQSPLHIHDQPLLVRSTDGYRWQTRSGNAELVHNIEKANHLVWIGCDLPKLSELGGRARRTILLVKVCTKVGRQPPKEISTVGLAEGDLESFLLRNPEIPYLWLSVPEYERAVRLYPSFDWAGRPSLQKLKKWTKWRQDDWDRSLNAFRPRAVVDLVLSHRPLLDHLGPYLSTRDLF